MNWRSTASSYRTVMSSPLFFGRSRPMPDGLSTNVHLPRGTQDDIPSTEEKERARALALNRECPHCGEIISLADAVAMVQGHGWEYWVQVQIADGRTIAVRSTEVNPQTMRVVQA